MANNRRTPHPKRKRTPSSALAYERNRRSPPQNSDRSESPRDGQLPAVSRPARKRGGQPGNLNALKHGLYSRHFSADELAQLQAVTEKTLNGEIGLTRIAAHRILELLDQAEGPEEKLALLNAMSQASMRVASLLKTQKYLEQAAKLCFAADDLTDALSQALEDVAEEERLKAEG